MMSAWKYSSCLTDVEHDALNILLSAFCRYGKFIFSLVDLCGRYSCLKFWRMLEHPLFMGIHSLSVAYEFIFPLLYVVKDVGTSNVYGNLCFLFVALKFIFPLLLREFTAHCFIAWKIYFFPSLLISVKKELNRLYILGTLIAWFASYPTKSSQILKNHSIMLFTSNANSL